MRFCLFSNSITFEVIEKPPERGDDRNRSNPKEIIMPELEQLAENYIAVWNETDAEKRRVLIENTFASSSSYHDPLMQADGHAGIDGLVAAIHNQFPGFRFRLDGPVDGYADKIRFSWTLGPDHGEAPIRGTDFAETGDGRFTRVTGFLDRVPAAA